MTTHSHSDSNPHSQTDMPFDLVLYNAGMDVHEDSAIGGAAGMTTDVIAAREQTVFEWARKRGVGVAFILAGGYTGGRLVKHARYYWLLLAESHLTRRLFGSMLQRIWALRVPTG